MINRGFLFALLLNILFISAGNSPALAQQTIPNLNEPDFFKEAVASGDLPEINQRVPMTPLIVSFKDVDEKQIGQYGGTLRILGGRSKDTRLMVIYGYTRLVGYNTSFEIVPDIVERFEVDGGKIFTFHLRKGHFWSDGHPFTTEDFKYYWEDIANNPEISVMGLPQALKVDGEPPRVDIIDPLTVRYSWSKPNPFFLPALANAQPLYIFKPAHYLKQFHADYVDPEIMEEMVEQSGQRNWISLHISHDRPYKNTNPDRPTLQPWKLITRPPSDRFIFERNPYYYRIDEQGNQLPYIDQVAMTIASSKLVPAKTGSGESDLQARYLNMSNYTFLKQGEKRNNFKVHRWATGLGAKIAIYPNMNVNDPGWRALFQQADFRRALSISINRHDINQVIYYGLALEGNNTVLPQSVLSKPHYQTQWAQYDPDQANEMLDRLGLSERNDEGIRLLPDGRGMEIIVETAGEDTEQTDVLELIRDDWRKIGIKMFIKPLQREVFRRRIYSGESMVAVWFGLENALATPSWSPGELAPTKQNQLQWPKWGLHYESNGLTGETSDLPEVQRLFTLNQNWKTAVGRAEKTAIWDEMLDIHADQVFSIGLIRYVSQVVVINNRLHNVPEYGIYNWNPGAHFGVYKPDTFWFSSPDDESVQP